MPGVDVRYAEWLSTKPLSGVQVDAIEVRYLDQIVYFANKILDPVALPDEFGDPHTYIPYDFTIAMPKKDQSTQSSITITGPAMNGKILGLFGNVKGIDLNGEGYVTYRCYLIPDAMDKPMWLPPPRLALISFSVGRASLQIDASAPQLPRRRAGHPYTAEEFPGLVILS